MRPLAAARRSVRSKRPRPRRRRRAQPRTCDARDGGGVGRGTPRVSRRRRWRPARAAPARTRRGHRPPRSAAPLITRRRSGAMTRGGRRRRGTGRAATPRWASGTAATVSTSRSNQAGEIPLLRSRSGSTPFDIQCRGDAEDAATAEVASGRGGCCGWILSEA